MASVVHEWTVRAVCPTCGYLWTTPGSPNVVCKCGKSAIANGVLSGDAQEVTNEAAFETAVSVDVGFPLEELIILGP